MNTATMLTSWVIGHPSVIVAPACLIAATLLLVIAVQLGGDPLPAAAVRAPERHTGWDEHPGLLTAMVDEHRANLAAAAPVIPGPDLDETPTEVITVEPAPVVDTGPLPRPRPGSGWFERRTHQGRHHQQDLGTTR